LFGGGGEGGMGGIFSSILGGMGGGGDDETQKGGMGGGHGMLGGLGGGSSGSAAVNININGNSIGIDRGNSGGYQVPQPSTCPDDFVGHPQRGCFLLSPMKAKRDEASRYCRAFNSRLVSIETPAINYQLKYHIHKANRLSDTFWTSGRKVGAKWEWESTGNSVSYTHYSVPAQNTNDTTHWNLGTEGCCTAYEFQSVGSSDKCILLKKSGADIMWDKNQKCINTNEHFICHLTQHNIEEAARRALGHFSDDSMGLIQRVMAATLFNKIRHHPQIYEISDLLDDKMVSRSQRKEFIRDHGDSLVQKGNGLIDDYMKTVEEEVKAFVGEEDTKGGNEGGGTTGRGGGKITGRGGGGGRGGGR